MSNYPIIITPTIPKLKPEDLPTITVTSFLEGLANMGVPDTTSARQFTMTNSTLRLINYRVDPARPDIRPYLRRRSWNKDSVTGSAMFIGTV